MISSSSSNDTMNTMNILKWITLLVLPLCCDGTRHSFRVHNDPRPLIGPVGLPFGYYKNGEFEIKVFDFELKATGGDATSLDPKFLEGFWGGFYLSKFENEATFNQYMEHLANNVSHCSYQYFREGLGLDDGTDAMFEDADDDYFDGVGESITADHGLLVPMNDPKKDWKPNVKEFRYTFHAGEEGLYFLLYQICPTDRIPEGIEIKSSFELDFHFRNYDTFHRPSYLTAGEMCLPMMYLFFTLSYSLCLFLWVYNIQQIEAGASGLFEEKGKPTVYPIHKLMAVLMVLKTLSVFFESARYHYIRVTGHAEFWDFVYYVFTFMKGTMLFTVILLIGSGWSTMKPFLHEREKKVIFIVLILQVLNQLVMAIVSSETSGERLFGQWTALLHIIDIVCCCMVLLPIVWQVDALEKSIEIPEDHNKDDDGDGNEHDEDTILFGAPERSLDDLLEDGDDSDKSRDKTKIIARLKLFRSYYLLVVAYIYCTRILVYLFANLLNYRWLWVQHFTIEVISLAFYALSGLQFRPKIENAYSAVAADDDDEEISEAELENGNQGAGIEMKSTGKGNKKDGKKKTKPKPKKSSKEID